MILTAMITGCESRVDDSFTGFETGYHEFDGLAGHAAYLEANGYPLNQCAECHGDRLDGDGKQNMNCTACHHPFGSENHPAHLQETNYNFTECAQCHSADLRGGGSSYLNCYECHNAANHTVHFEQASDHPQWMKENGWQMTDCYHCHLGEQSSPPEFSFGTACAECHNTPLETANCNACHGSFGMDLSDTTTWAPPEDLAGNLSTDSLGVGAHQTHLTAPSGITQPIQCASCHTVPGMDDALAHLGQDPGQAEVTFGGLAVGDTLNPPVWDAANASCSATYCHAGATPVWTQVDGTWNECGACHSIPPEDDTHGDWINRQNCNICHGSVMDAEGEIKAPELHINGRIDMN